MVDSLLRKFVPNNRGLCSLFGAIVRLSCNPNGTTVRNMPTFSHIAMSRHRTKERLRELPSRWRDVFQARSSVSSYQPRPRFAPRPFACINGAVEMPQDLSGRANSHRGLGQQPTPDTPIRPSDQMVGPSSSSSCSRNWPTRGLAEVHEQQTRALMRHEGEQTREVRSLLTNSAPISAPFV